jgi:hypothetical protein
VGAGSAARRADDAEPVVGRAFARPVGIAERCVGSSSTAIIQTMPEVINAAMRAFLRSYEEQIAPLQK